LKKQCLSSEYQSNFTTMVKRKTKPLIRPNSIFFQELSRCDVKVHPFSALISLCNVIRTKWCKNSANSTHFTHPILNLLERGWNVRILPNTYRRNKTRFIERISVELHFYGQTKVKASNSTYFNVFLIAVKVWWESTSIFGPNFAMQCHTYNMMWKQR
jgi:hypothetical protein